MHPLDYLRKTKILQILPKKKKSSEVPSGLLLMKLKGLISEIFIESSDNFRRNFFNTNFNFGILIPHTNICTFRIKKKTLCRMKLLYLYKFCEWIVKSLQDNALTILRITTANTTVFIIIVGFLKIKIK